MMMGLFASALALAIAGVSASPLAVETRSTALSCTNNASNNTVYISGTNSYLILCATDYYGGDLSSTTTTTLEGCVAACDALSGCLDVRKKIDACPSSSQQHEDLTCTSRYHTWAHPAT